MSDTLQRPSVCRRAHDVRRADVVDARHDKPKSTQLPAPRHPAVEQSPTDAPRDALAASLSYSAQAAAEYTADLWQRTWLYADIMRQRGNQYLEHLDQVVPHVLSFAYEPILLGPTLPRP